MPRYEIKKLNKMVCEVRVHLKKGEKDFNIFIAPDQHWDNPKCDRKLLKKHLDEAVAQEALIVMPGDTFCLMQGKWDPRRSKKDIRPEHNVHNYLDAVINDAIEWYKPYAKNMVLGNGNHETAILKNLETDVLERFAGGLNSGVPVMGYHGWVMIKVLEPNSNKVANSLNLYFHHGYGGGGAVTRGQISMSRHMMSVEGADIISQGHIHEKSNTEVMMHYLDTNPSSNSAKLRSVLLVQSSTYKQEFTEGGFHIEKGRPAKPLGGVFVNVEQVRDENESRKLIKKAMFYGTQTITL
jgi:hypothetical protein